MKNISRQERAAIIRWGIVEKKFNPKFSTHDIGERLKNLGRAKGKRTLERLMSEIKMAVASEKYSRQLETTMRGNYLGSTSFTDPSAMYPSTMLVKCPVIVQKVPDYEDYYVGYWPLCNRPTAYLVQGTMLCEAHARYALHGRDYSGKPVSIQPTDFETCNGITDENHCWLPGEIRCLCIKGLDGNDIPL